MGKQTARFAAINESQGAASSKKTIATPVPVSKAPSRLEQLEQLLMAATGCTITEMMEATGWQQHSVRGAMAGALKKRGLTITSQKADGVRRYRAEKRA